MKFILFICTYSAFLSVARADISVASGNTLGESTETYQGPFAVPYPSTPGNVFAERLSADLVRVRWDGVLAGAEKYIIYRATGSSPWVELGWAITGEHPQYIDTAPGDERYRYALVARSDEMTVPVLGTIKIQSPPSESPLNTVLDDYKVKMRAGSGVYSAIHPGVPYPAGYFSLSDFFPIDWDANQIPPDFPPNPFTISGPFTTETNDPSGYRYKGEHEGFIPGAKWLSATGLVSTSHHDEIPFLELENAAANTGFIPPPVTVDGGDSWSITLGASYATYNVNYTSPTRENGFDPVSNPPWAMVPTDSARFLGVDIEPYVPNRKFDAFTGEGVGILPNSVPTGGETVHLTAQNSGDSMLQLNGLRYQMGIDARHPKTVKVKIVMLVATVGGVNKTGPWTTPPNGDLLAIRLDNIFKYQANIHFQCSVEPTYITQTDDDGMLVMHQPFQNYQPIANFYINRDHVNLVVFLVQRPGVITPSGPKEVEGVASDIEGNYAFIRGTASVATIAHEIGHLLGLHHPWDEGTPYSIFSVPDDSRQRLMGYDNTANYIIKPERDQLHVRVSAF